MRRLVAGSLAALMLMFGVPVVGIANGSAATVLGQVVDAGGRASSGKTVELVQNGAVISIAVTTADGRFTFNSITPGTYQVRTMVNSQPAGVQLSLKAGEAAQAVVVLPTMATSAAQAQFASLLASLSTTVAGTTLATVVSELAADAAADNDEDQITESIQTQATAQVLIAALTNNTTLNPAQLQAVANALGQIIVSLPPNAPPELLQTINTFIQQVQTNTGPGGGTVGAGGIVIPIPAAPVQNNNPSNGSATL